eukprot:scaffold24631_cov33-Tisochrysis_lutea.AAC.1
MASEQAPQVVDRLEVGHPSPHTYEGRVRCVDRDVAPRFVSGTWLLGNIARTLPRRSLPCDPGCAGMSPDVSKGQRSPHRAATGQWWRARPADL